MPTTSFNGLSEPSLREVIIEAERLVAQLKINELFSPAPVKDGAAIGLKAGAVPSLTRWPQAWKQGVSSQCLQLCMVARKRFPPWTTALACSCRFSFLHLDLAPDPV